MIDKEKKNEWPDWTWLWLLALFLALVNIDLGLSRIARALEALAP